MNSCVEGICDGSVGTGSDGSSVGSDPAGPRGAHAVGVAVAGPDDTQPRVATGVVAELEAEGYHDAEPVGRGGFGVVYRCNEPSLDRVVAIKVLSSDQDDLDLKRFALEQRAMGRVSGHPNIVPVFHSGLTFTGRPYIVMPAGLRRDHLDQRRRPRAYVQATLQYALCLAIAGDSDEARRVLAPALRTVAALGLSRLLLDEGLQLLRLAAVTVVADEFTAADPTTAANVREFMLSLAATPAV